MAWRATASCVVTRQNTRVAYATRWNNLVLSDFQALDQRAIASVILALEIIEQLAAAAYQAQQATAGMVILGIVLEMLGQISDACSDQGHLHFGRTSVALGTLKVGNDLRFLRGGNCHWSSLLKKCRILRLNAPIAQG